MPAINIADLNNAKLDVDHIAAFATSPDLTVTDRLGNTKTSISGAKVSIATDVAEVATRKVAAITVDIPAAIASVAAINNRGAWAAATVYSAGYPGTTKDIALFGTTWYICVIPHTSSAAFATDAPSKWRVYQGVIPSDIAAIVGRITPEMFGGVAYPTRASAETGTDSTSAISQALNLWSTAGGTLFLSGWYRVGAAFFLVNSNTPTTFGVQPPLRITGIGGHGSGRGGKANSGAGIVWTAEAGTAVAKIDTRGNGLIVLDNCTLASSSASGNVKPFVHTTFTVIKTGVGFALDGGTYGAGAKEDGFVLGGESSHETIPGFDLSSSDAGFQGYGTIINGVQCNGLRRLAVLQRYANAVRITNNNIWNTCGNNSATGGAIEVNGAPSGTPGFAVGAFIHGNLIELTHYKHGIHLKNAAHTDIAGNDGYDAGPATLSVVYVDVETCQNTRIRPSLAPAGRTYIFPDAQTNDGIFVSGAEASFYDVATAMKSGRIGSPNIFGPTTFKTPLETVFQSDGATGTGSLLTLKRGLTDTTDPGATVMKVDGAGGIALGNLGNAGNVANALPTGASKWSNGRNWGFNGLAGAGMGQNSGMAGSSYTAQNNSFIWKDHTGANQARLLSTAASGGGIGMDFGPAYDVSLYRFAPTVLRTNVKFTASLGLGVGNSVAATTPGAVVRKMEVFDASGASLGFVPIYSSIA